MINTSLHETINNQTTLTCGNEKEIQDESSHDDTAEVGRAWIEGFDIARINDVAVYEAGTDTTD